MEVPGSSQFGALLVTSIKNLSQVEPSLYFQKRKEGKHVICGVNSEVEEQLARAVPRYRELLRDLSRYSAAQWVRESSELPPHVRLQEAKAEQK